MSQNVKQGRMDKHDISEAAAILGRKGGKIGGKSRSPAKVAAVRENGKLGGRPRLDSPKPAFKKRPSK